MAGSIPESMRALMRERIVILDGAIGRVLAGYGLREEEVRGEEFADLEAKVRYNIDLLTLTRPEIVETVHRAYLNAGADIISTNTFMASAIAQAKFGLADQVARMNREAGELARRVVDDFVAFEPDRSIFVLGCIGPEDAVPDTAGPDILAKWRRMPEGEYEAAIAEQAEGLIQGGADILGLETVPCIESALAMARGVGSARKRLGSDLPYWISVTVTENGDALLSGESLDAFVEAVAPFAPALYGVNCGYGKESVAAAIARLAQLVQEPVVAYPSAGIPNESGIHPDDPETTAAWAREIAESGTVNVIGGCCGTTPEHIRQIVTAVADIAPRGLQG